jgi:hypothetical protein
MMVLNYELKVMDDGINSLYGLAMNGILLAIQQVLTQLRGNGKVYAISCCKYLHNMFQRLRTVFLFLDQVKVPFSSLKPVFRARTMTDAPPFDASNITSLQVSLLPFFLHQ